MKAVRIHEHGGQDVLRWEDIEIPDIGDDQVLVNIKATAMNHLDLWVRNGIPGVPLPIILGSDGVGIIEKKGIGVKGYEVGDAVVIQPLTYCGRCRFCRKGLENYCESWGILGENQDGTMAEYIAVDEKNIRLKPRQISWENAASFSLVGQTAYTMLVRRANIQFGEFVLVWGAASGVGSMAVQIARAKGCKVIATGGNSEKLALAKELGADKVVNHYEEDVVVTVKAFTDGNMADVVFEHVGAKTWKTSLNALGKGGRIVTCGATTGSKIELDLRHMFYKQQTIMGSTMGDVAAYDDVLSMVNTGDVKPVVDKVFKMEDIRKAHDYLENGNQIGKVVLVP